MARKETLTEEESRERRRVRNREKMRKYREKNPLRERLQGRVGYYMRAGLSMEESRIVASKAGEKLQQGSMSLKTPHGVMFSIYRGWQDCSLDEIAEAVRDRKGKLDILSRVRGMDG